MAWQRKAAACRGAIVVTAPTRVSDAIRVPGANGATFPVRGTDGVWSKSADGVKPSLSDTDARAWSIYQNTDATAERVPTAARGKLGGELVCTGLGDTRTRATKVLSSHSSTLEPILWSGRGDDALQHPQNTQSRRTRFVCIRQLLLRYQVRTSAALSHAAEVVGQACMACRNCRRAVVFWPLRGIPIPPSASVEQQGGLSPTALVASGRRCSTTEFCSDDGVKVRPGRPLHARFPNPTLMAETSHARRGVDRSSCRK